MPTSVTRNMVTGGAGFVGSHLIDRLMLAGEEVICLDNYFTGRKSNIALFESYNKFSNKSFDDNKPNINS